MFANYRCLQFFVVLLKVSIFTCRQEENNVQKGNRFTLGKVDISDRMLEPMRERNEPKIANSESIPASCTKNLPQPCSNLSADCMQCALNESCIYGHITKANCTVIDGINCEGKSKFEKSYLCAYCYQLPTSYYDCLLSSNCRSNSRYLTNCSVNQNVICLGKRVFPKYLTCNFVSGYKWSTALILSITLGGFGIDRFYLGNWQEGIGKLFSFGGLGVWTLVDIILIATGYLKPADGSRYM